MKEYELGASDSFLTIRYHLPAALKTISVECALSPDYLTLLRSGSTIATPIESERSRGFAVPGVSVFLESGSSVRWEQPEQECGHGWIVRVGTAKREFQLRLRAEASAMTQEAA